jgi:hypothetical protein
MSFFDIRAGHLFVAADWTAPDPASEQRRLDAARAAGVRPPTRIAAGSGFSIGWNKTE